MVGCTFSHSVQFNHSVVSDSCDPMNCSTPGLPVHHQLPEFTQTHVHWVNDAIQPSYPLKGALRRRAPFSCLNLSQHQDLFLLELFFVVHVFLEDCLFHQCWGFFPPDSEVTNLKEGHSDSLLQGLTSLFLQSSLFIEVGTKSLEYKASRVHTGLIPNQ